MHEYSSVSASSYDPGALVAKLNEAAADGWDVVSIVPTGGDVSAFLRREAAGDEAEAAEGGAMAGLEGGEAPASAGEWVAEGVVVEAVADTPVEAWSSEAGSEVAEAGESEVSETVGEAAGLAVGSELAGDLEGTGDAVVAEGEDIVEVSVDGAGDTATEAVDTAVEEPAGWAAAPEAAADEAAATGEGLIDTTAEEVTPAEVAAGAAAAEAVAAPEPEPEPVAAEPEPAPAPAPAPEPAPVVTTPAGWYPDPSTRYELRYWDGTQWTEHVARQGQQFTDPPIR
jgi:hypothetical protein